MIASVTRHDGALVTSHSTFLSQGGRKADIERPRLLSAGATSIGCGIWFNSLGSRLELAIAEGLESALSAALLYDAEASVAALSAHGMRSLVLSPSIRRPVRIFSDNDGSGLDAARDLYRRLRSEGREVVVTIADNAGEDANDVLLRRQGARS